MLSLTAVAVWTARAQRRYDSLSIAASAGALLPGVLTLLTFALHLSSRSLHPQAVFTAQSFTVAAAAAALLALLSGPWLFFAALWLRVGSALPASVAILQLCHLLLWAVLTLLAVGLVFGA